MRDLTAPLASGALCVVFTGTAGHYLPFWLNLAVCFGIGLTVGWFSDRVSAWIRGPVRDR